MKRQLLGIVIAAGVSGCAAVPQKSIAEACIDMRYTPGTALFLECVQDQQQYVEAEARAEEERHAAGRAAVIQGILNNMSRPVFIQQPRFGPQIWIPPR